jgi:hypothetical protein
MNAFDWKYFPYQFQKIIDRVRLIIDPIITEGTPPVQSGGLVPYYEFGTYLELVGKLSSKDNNQILKYPLVWLVWDGNENKQTFINEAEYNISPRIFICDLVGKDQNTDERETNTIHPILYPIFNAISDQIQIYENISTLSGYTIDLDEHPFWLRTDIQIDTLSSIEIKINNLLIFM